MFNLQDFGQLFLKPKTAFAQEILEENLTLENDSKKQRK
jgi:hypothetical protein